MAKLSELQIDIVANTSSAEKALKDVSKTAEQVGKGLQTLASNLNGLNHQNLGLVESSLRHVRDMVASIGGASIKITVNPIHDQLNNITKEVESVTKSHWNLGIGAKLNSDFDSATKQAKSTMDSIKDKQVAVDQTFKITVSDVDDKAFEDWKTKYEDYCKELQTSRLIKIKLAPIDHTELDSLKRVYTTYRNSLLNLSKLEDENNKTVGKFGKIDRIMERLEKGEKPGVTPLYMKVVVDRRELDAFRNEIDAVRLSLGSSPIEVQVDVSKVQGAINNGDYSISVGKVLAADGVDLAQQAQNLIGAIEITIKRIRPYLEDSDDIEDAVSEFITKVQNPLKEYFLEIYELRIAEDADVIKNFVTLISEAIKKQPVIVAFEPDENSITEFANKIRQEATSTTNLNIGLDGRKANSITGALDKIAEGVEKAAERISKASSMVSQLGEIGTLLGMFEKHDLKAIGDGMKAFASGVDALSKIKSLDQSTFDTINGVIQNLDDVKMGKLAPVLQPFGEAMKAFGDYIKSVPGMGNKSFAWINDLFTGFDADKVASLSQNLTTFSNGLSTFFNAISTGAPKGQAINITPFVKMIEGLSSASSNIIALEPILGSFGTHLSETLTKLSVIPSPQGDLTAYARFFNSLDGGKIGSIGTNIVGFGQAFATEVQHINDAIKNADTDKIKVFSKLLKEFNNIQGGNNVQGLVNVATVIETINRQLANSSAIDPKITPLVALGSLKSANVSRLANAFEKLTQPLVDFFTGLANAPDIPDSKIQALERIASIDFTQLKDLYKAMKAVQNAGNLAGNGGGLFGGGGNGGGFHFGEFMKSGLNALKTLSNYAKTTGKVFATLLTPEIKAAQLALKGLGEASKLPFKLISNGAKLAVEGLKRLISHFTQAGKSSLSLGEKFTRMVASFWAIRRIVWIFKRVFGWIKDSALSAMNFIESYHFFDMVTQNLGEKKYEQTIKETSEETKKVAEETANSIRKVADAIGNNETLTKGVEKVKNTLGSMWDSVASTEAGKKIGKVYDVIIDKSKELVESATTTPTKSRARQIRGKTPQIDAVSSAAPTMKAEVDAISGAAPNLKKTSHELTETTKSFSKLEKALKKDRFLKSTTETGEKFRELEKSAKKLSKANEGVAKSYEKVADKVNEASQKTKQYADEIKSSMLDLNEKMTGYTYDEEGNATSTGNKSLGMDADMLLQYQGTYAQMASGMGLAADEATTVSNALSMLAGDWSSLRNISFESSFQKMTQALAGQSRAVRSLGIDISQARLQQLLYDNGIDVSITKLNNAQKTELRMIAILEQSKVAYGDLAKTINTPANQLRMLEQNLKNLSRAFGNLFIPMLKTVLPYLNGVAIALTRIFQYIGSLMGVKISDSVTSSKDIDPYENIEESADDAEESVTSLKRSVQGFDQLHILSNASSADMGDGIQDTLDDLLNADYQKYLDEWSKAFDEMKNKAQEIADKILKFLKELKEAFDWSEFGEKAAQKINEFIEKVRKLLDWNNLRDIVEPWIRRFTSFFNGLIENINWTALGEAIGNGLNSWFHIIRDFFDGINWQLLGEKLAEGLNSLIHTIDWANMGAAFASQLNAWIRGAFGFLSTFNWKEFGDSIGRMLNSMIRNIDWVKLQEDIVLFINGVIDAGIAFIERFDFVALAQKITNLVNHCIDNINWDKLGELFGKGVKKIFEGINEFAKETKWRELGKNIGKAMKKFLDEIDFGEIGETFKNLFFGIFSAINGWFEEFNGVDENGEKGLTKIGKKIADFVNNLIDEPTMNEAGQAFSNAFNGIFQIALGFVENFEWLPFTNALISGIRTAIHGIDSELVANTIKGIVDTLLKMFATFVDSGVLEEFGKKIGETLKFTAKEWEGWFSVAADNIKKALKRLFTGLSAGLFEEGSLGQGFFDGLTDGALSVLTVIENLAKALGKLAEAIAGIGGKKFDVEGNLVMNGEETGEKTISQKVGEVAGNAVVGVTAGNWLKNKFFGKAGKTATTAATKTGGGGFLDKLGTLVKFNGLETLTNPATWGIGAVGAMTTAKAVDEYKHLDQNTAAQPFRSFLDMRADIPEEVKTDLNAKLNKATSVEDFGTSSDMIAEALNSSGVDYSAVASWGESTGLTERNEGFKAIMDKWKTLKDTGASTLEEARTGVVQVGDTFTKYTDNGRVKLDEMNRTWGRSLEGKSSQVKSAVSKGRELVTVGGEVTATYQGVSDATEHADHVARAHNDTVIQGKSNVVDFGQTAVETFTDIGMVTETSAEKFSQLHIEASKPLPDNYSTYLTPLLTQLGVSKEGVKNLNAEIDSGKIPIQSVGDLYDVLMAKFGGTEENVSKINGIFSTYFGTEMPNSVNTTQGAIDGMSNALGNVPSKYEALEGAGTQAFGNVTTGTQDYDAILQKVQSRIADPSSFQSLGFNSEQANAYLRNELGLSEGEIQTFWEAVKNNEAFDQFVKNDQTAMQEATRQVGLSDEAIKSMFGTVNDPTGFDNFQKFSSEANNFLRNEFGYSDEQIQAFWRGIANGSEASQEVMGILVDVMADHLGMMGVDVGELGKKFDTDLPQSVQTGVEEVSKSLESLTGDLGLGEDELGIEIFDPTGTMSVFEKAKISDVPYYKPLDKVKNALSSLTTDADKTKSNVIGSANEMVKGIEDKGKDFSDAGKSSGLSIESGMASAEPEIKKTASSLVNTAIGEAKTKSNDFATVGANGISAMTAVMGKDTSLATATKTLTTEKMINTAHDVLTKDATGAPFLGREFDSNLASGMNANAKALDDASRQAGNNIFAPFKEEAFITDTKKLGEDFDSNVGAGIDNNVEQAKTPAKNLKDGIVAEFDSVSSDIAGKFSDIGTAIQNTLNGVDMQSCVDILSSKFSGLPLAVANQFGNFSGETLVSLQNAGQAFATNFGNYVTSAMSTLKLPTPHYDVTSYNSVDNGNGGSINVPVFALNWYARGGFPRSGELFVANEAGPEMVGKMGSGTAVANNLQIIEGIAQGVASSLRSFVPYITEGTKDAVYGMKEFFSSMLPYITDSTVQTAVSLAEDLRQTLYEVAKSTRNDNYVAADRVEWCMRESFNDYRNYDASNTHQVADELSDRLIEGLYSVTRDTTDYIVDNLVDARGTGSADGKPYVMNINLMIDRDVVVRQVQEGILGQQDRMVNSY